MDHKQKTESWQSRIPYPRWWKHDTTNPDLWKFDVFFCSSIFMLCYSIIPQLSGIFCKNIPLVGHRQIYHTTDISFKKNQPPSYPKLPSLVAGLASHMNIGIFQVPFFNRNHKISQNPLRTNPGCETPSWSTFLHKIVILELWDYLCLCLHQGEMCISSQPPVQRTKHVHKTIPFWDVVAII